MVAHTVAAAKAALAAKAKPRKGSYTVTKPTGAMLTLVKPYLVDRAVRWAQKQDNICELFESALRAVFGTEPANGWRDSEGYDCRGYDVEDFDRAGYDQNGWNGNGFDVFGQARWDRSTEGLVALWGEDFKTRVRELLVREHDREERAADAMNNQVGWPTQS